jgi:hypothetical protein
VDTILETERRADYPALRTEPEVRDERLLATSTSAGASPSFDSPSEEKTRNGILSTLTALGESFSLGERVLGPGGVGLLKVDFSGDNLCHAENYSPSRRGSFSMPPRAMNAGWFATTP